MEGVFSMLLPRAPHFSVIVLGNTLFPLCWSTTPILIYVTRYSYSCWHFYLLYSCWSIPVEYSHRSERTRVVPTDLGGVWWWTVSPRVWMVCGGVFHILLGWYVVECHIVPGWCVALECVTFYWKPLLGSVQRCGWHHFLSWLHAFFCVFPSFSLSCSMPTVFCVFFPVMKSLSYWYFSW